MIYREDCRRVDDLCTEVAELHSLDKRQLVDDVGIVDDTRVGCHEAIDIGPYLEHLGLKGCSYDGSSIVRTTATKVGDFACDAVGRDETAHHDDWALAFGLDLVPHCHDIRIGLFEVADVLVPVLGGLDDIAAVDPCGTLDDCGNDAA